MAVTKAKTFDCVEMMHRGAAAVRERLRGMTAEQEIEYWRKRGEELLRLQQELRRKAESKV